MRKKTLLFFMFCLFGYVYVDAQTFKVTGTVTDASSGEKLPGVSIVQKGTNKGAISDLTGNFSITVPDKNAVIVFSFIGYISETATVNGRNVLNIKLSPLAKDLGEVVVIAYGSVKKSDLTGSVSSVKSEDLQKTSISSFQQGLQGRLAGVEVVQGDATPGGGTYIQIRGVSTMLGSTEPLYVVDGVPFNIARMGGTTSAAGFSNTNPLSMIAPSDIESIEVLKDASSTAIYGSQGANGVILITTKKGLANKGTVSFTTNQSVSVISKKVQVLNAREYAEYQNEAYANAYPYNPVNNWPWPINNTDPKKLSPTQLEALVGKGVNWQDEIYHPAPVKDYQLSFTGGSDKGSYALMLNYLDQNGILKNTGYQRSGVRLNADHKINNFLKVTANVSFTNSKNRLVKTSTNDGSALSGGVVRKALTYSPIPAILRDPVTGNIIGISSAPPDTYDTEDPNYQNNWGATPLRFLEDAKINQELTTLTGNVELNFSLLKGLTFKTRLGGIYNAQLNDNYFPRTLNEGKTVNGLAQTGSNFYKDLITENLLSYNFTLLKKHKVDLLGGFTYDDNMSRFVNTQASGFADDRLKYWNLGSALITSPNTNGTSQWDLVSYFGRANYTFNDRYLFTYTYRKDGSSKFAKNNKWADFNSLAFAWRINNEAFLKNLRWLSNLKFRASYGESGNQGLSPYQSLSTMSANTAVVGNNLVNSFSETSQENAKLKWETTSQLNGGLDIGLFNERLTATVNVYNKVTRDLLQKVTMPPNTGYSSKSTNSGKIENRGLEIEISGRPIATKKFNWTVSANYYVNKNKVLDLGGQTEQFATAIGSAYGLNAQPFIQRVGQPIGALYGYVTDGVFQNQAEVNAYVDPKTNLPINNGAVPVAVGMVRFKDLNKDGVINTLDQTIIGNTNPDFFWGFNSNLSYKSFDLGIFLNGIQGGDILNTNIIMPEKLNSEGNIPVWLYQDAWRGDGTTTTQRQIKNGNEEPKRFTRLYLDDRTFIRVKNISIGYSFNTSKIKYLSALNLHFNAINLFTLTKYKGYDPEVSANSSPLSRGLDMGSYPQARTFTITVNATFR